MEQSKKPFKVLNFNNSLVRIGDLVNSDGPLLTLFEDVRNDNLYVFDWVDRFDNTNRWLIYQINKQKLFDFVQAKITFLELFKNAINDNYYYTDIISNAVSFNNSRIVSLEVMPEKYFPDKNDFFDKADCPDFDKILHFLINQKQGNFLFLNSRLNTKYIYFIDHVASAFAFSNLSQPNGSSTIGRHYEVKRARNKYKRYA